MPEEGNNRKPVGQSTNHGCLGKSGDPFPGTMPFLAACHYKDDGRAYHQAGSDFLVPAKQLFSLIHLFSPGLLLAILHGKTKAVSSA
jgi:hypothetical protein